KNTADHGLFGDGVDGFTLRDSIVFNFGNASASGPAGPSEDGLHFESTNNANTAAGHGLTGTVIIQRDAIGPDGHFVLNPNPPTPFARSPMRATPRFRRMRRRMQQSLATLSAVARRS